MNRIEKDVQDEKKVTCAWCAGTGRIHTPKGILVCSVCLGDRELYPEQIVNGYVFEYLGASEADRAEVTFRRNSSIISELEKLGSHICWKLLKDELWDEWRLVEIYGDDSWPDVREAVWRGLRELRLNSQDEQGK